MALELIVCIRVCRAGLIGVGGAALVRDGARAIQVRICVRPILIDGHTVVRLIVRNGSGMGRRVSAVLNDRDRRLVTLRPKNTAVPSISTKPPGHRAAALINTFAQFYRHTGNLAQYRLSTIGRALGQAWANGKTDRIKH